MCRNVFKSDQSFKDRNRYNVVYNLIQFMFPFKLFLHNLNICITNKLAARTNTKGLKAEEILNEIHF